MIAVMPNSAHAVVHVVAALASSALTPCNLSRGQVGTGEVSRPPSSSGSNGPGVQGVLAGFTAGDGFAAGRDYQRCRPKLFGEVAGGSPLKQRISSLASVGNAAE